MGPVYVKEGERVRIGYGLVGYDYARNAAETLPIPLNYIKRLWYFLLRKDADYLSSQGFHDRLSEEWRKGYDHGYLELKKDLKEEYLWKEIESGILDLDHAYKDVRDKMEKELPGSFIDYLKRQEDPSSVGIPLMVFRERKRILKELSMADLSLRETDLRK